MIRKAIIVALTLGAVATGCSCLRTAFSPWWWFSFGEVGVEFEDSALIVSSGGMFLVDQPLGLSDFIEAFSISRIMSYIDCTISHLHLHSHRLTSEYIGQYIKPMDHHKKDCYLDQ